MSAGYPELSLDEIKTLLLLRDYRTVRQQLMRKGLDIQLPAGNWNPLAGGREYLSTSPVIINFNDSEAYLSFEVSRITGESAVLVNHCRIFPLNATQASTWPESMYNFLAENFPEVENGTNFHIFRKDLFEGMLNEKPEDPHLLFSTRNLIRN